MIWSRVIFIDQVVILNKYKWNLWLTLVFLATEDVSTTMRVQTTSKVAWTFFLQHNMELAAMMNHSQIWYIVLGLPEWSLGMLWPYLDATLVDFCKRASMKVKHQKDPKGTPIQGNPSF